MGGNSDSKRSYQGEDFDKLVICQNPLGLLGGLYRLILMGGLLSETPNTLHILFLIMMCFYNEEICQNVLFQNTSIRNPWVCLGTL